MVKTDVEIVTRQHIHIALKKSLWISHSGQSSPPVEKKSITLLIVSASNSLKNSSRIPPPPFFFFFFLKNMYNLKLIIFEHFFLFG